MTQNLTIIFISHDLPVIRQMCDRIGVLKDGKLCDVANTGNIFLKPHNFTCLRIADIEEVDT